MMQVKSSNSSGSSQFAIAIFLLLLILVGFIYCSGLFSRPTPEETVAQFCSALIQRDIKTAKGLCTASFASLELGAVDLLTLPMTWIPDDIKPDDSDILKFLDCSVDKETARVWYEGQDLVVLVLVKENGSWKIDRFGTNASIYDVIELMAVFFEW